MHDISSSKPIYLRFGVNVLHTFLHRLNHTQIKFFNFTMFKKFGIAKKKHVKRETFLSNGCYFVEKYFFDFSKVHAIAVSILIKSPFGLFA